MKISKHSVELGKYCLDISKAIVITVIIAPFTKNGFTLDLGQLVMFAGGIIASAGFLTFGLVFLNLKK